jgi:hypothetical protein
MQALLARSCKKAQRKEGYGLTLMSRSPLRIELHQQVVASTGMDGRVMAQTTTQIFAAV